MKLALSLAVFLSLPSVAVFSTASDGDKSDTKTAPLVLLTGNDSHVSSRSYHRVISEADWKKTWLSHLGLKHDTIYKTSLDVDFDKCMVIAIFGGKEINLCGYRVESIRDDRDGIRIRFSRISYQTAGPDGGDKRAMPYAFIILPKSPKAVVFNELSYTLNLDEPPVVREVARLDPIAN